jgi:N-acetylglucosaminyldiphosphoundecaprenol N-acetyl-beta-D-mannosaminyltransferase
MNNLLAQHRIDFLGCPLDLLTPHELLEDARHALRGERRLRVEGLNVAKLVDARSTPVLMRALKDAERVHIDGAGISLGLKVLGEPVPPRRAGIDLLGDLCALAADIDASVYLLGARPDVVELTVQHLLAHYPGLRIVGARDGYFRPEEEASIVESIRSSGADLLFIGMSSPKKELLLQKHWPDLGVKIGMGVGGSFDVLSGKLPRAPRWVQVIGMEWFFRLVLDPRRLLWRYVRTNAAYFFLLTFAKLKSIVQRQTGSRSNA